MGLIIAIALPSLAAAYITSLLCRFAEWRGRQATWGLAPLGAIAAGALTVMFLDQGDIFRPSEWSKGNMPLTFSVLFFFPVSSGIGLVLALAVVGHYRQESGVSEIEDGTWTLKVLRRRGSVLSVFLERSSIVHPRFRRARFIVTGEPAVFISADHLRAALRHWLDDPNATSLRPVKIDLEKGTVDGIRVEISRDGNA